MTANAIIDIDLTQEDGQGAKEYPSYDTITLRHLATFTDGYRDVRPKWPKPGMYYPFNPEPPRFRARFEVRIQQLAAGLGLLHDQADLQPVQPPPHSWPKDSAISTTTSRHSWPTEIGMAPGLLALVRTSSPTRGST